MPDLTRKVSSVLIIHVLPISIHLFCPASEGGYTLFLKYNFQLSHANEQPNKLNEFSSFKFLWGFIQNSLLPLQLMKARKKTHLAAAPFMKDLFHTDACLWVWLCRQTLIPALLLHYNWDTSRGDMYIWVCVHLEPSVVNYRLHVRVFGLVPLYGVQCNGSGLLHVLPDQYFAVCPIQVCHLNTGRPRVCPV